MFLAAKYEEIYPFKMRHVYDKIGHKKLSKKSVKDQEAEIIIHTNPVSSHFQRRARQYFA